MSEQSDYDEENKNQTELELECDQCAEYITMRIYKQAGIYSEKDLAMWIHDHFNTEV